MANRMAEYDVYGDFNIPELQESQSFFDKFKELTDKGANQVSPPAQDRGGRRLGEKVSGLLEAGKGLLGKLLGGGRAGRAREAVRGLDVTSNEGVLKMQRVINKTLPKDQRVKEDGVLGEETLKAMRQIQGIPMTQAPNQPPITVPQSTSTIGEDVPSFTSDYETAPENVQAPPPVTISPSIAPQAMMEDAYGMTEGERGAYGEWLQPAPGLPPRDTSAFAQQVAAANPLSNLSDMYPVGMEPSVPTPGYMGDPHHFESVMPNQPIQVAAQNQTPPPSGGGFRGGQPGYFGPGTGIQNRLLGAIGNWFTGGNPVQQQPPISKAPVNPYIGDDFGGQNRY